MYLHSFLAVLQGLLIAAYATDNGYQKVVTWDSDSLLINDERVFIFSGEFHYQRLPVPELWLDVFQKFKANGLNTVSIYFFWSYHSPSRGVYDFESPGKDVQHLLDLAKQSGLYVIARPGPYCNAETSAGGYALWTTNGSGGKYRTNDENYRLAWSEWVAAIGPILERNQITNGGPIILTQIENEFQETSYNANSSAVLYMEQLKTAFREQGIVVPLTHNEKGMRAVSWSTDYNNVGGAVDVYGLDSYPGGLGCSDNLDTGFNLVRTYHQWFSNYSFTQPSYLAEFEGGYFQPWGGKVYDDCLAEHSTEFADVYYKSVIGQKTTLFNIYMAYGGTNWGSSAAPVVFTSYDYSAPLRETREIQDKFKHTRLISLFTRVSKDLLSTVMESNGTGNAVNTTAIFTWVLRNPSTSAGFYLAENNNSKSRATTNFAIQVKTTLGDVAIPSMQLAGRQSRFVVTDYRISSDITFLYSTAEVISYADYETPVVAMYLKQGQVGEFAFKDTYQDLQFDIFGAQTDFNSVKANTTNAYTRFVYTQPAGATIVKFKNGLVVYLLDIPTAYTFFAPVTTINPNPKPADQIFVLGPYLVRSASISGSTVHVVGDVVNDTTIEVFPPSSYIDSISWNGAVLPTIRTSYGALVANIDGIQGHTFDLPTLDSWRVADSLPEADPGYDDTTWTVCDKNTTLSPVKPISYPVLYSTDYGYHSGIKLYRGTFAGPANSLNITVNGGSSTGFSAFLNGVYVGSAAGNASLATTSAVLDLAESATRGRNVVTLVTDYTGHDQLSVGPSGPQNPRGLLSATLSPSNASSITWKIQGNAGGEANIDPIRGPMNEGGLYGERKGWHLPGFNTTTWASGSPVTGLSTAGIAWYSTTFHLDIPSDMDVPLGIALTAPASTLARVQLFVNGYQYGHYVPHIGPQSVFPVPPGILNLRGENLLGLSLWAVGGDGARLEGVRVVEVGGRYGSGFGFGGVDGGRLQPGWEGDRERY
ncbi:beta-galactosidase precursor, partial [Pseudovirgaria hyperparasitica]